jgi:hypothetical protein
MSVGLYITNMQRFLYLGGKDFRKLELEKSRGRREVIL